MSNTIFKSVADTASETPSNQILVNFRTTCGGDRDVVNFFAEMEIRAIKRGDRTFFSSLEQEHAARVLSRVVALY